MWLRTLVVLAVLFSWQNRAQAEVSRNQFHTILDVIGNIYQDIFLADDKRLIIDRIWSSDESQASAWRQEDRKGVIAIVRLPGGIARVGLVNPDAFTLIVCHEIGHHLAGPPRVWKYSIEGQADYYSVSACLRRVLPSLPENSVMRVAETPLDVVNGCRHFYVGTEEQKICMRSALAGARLAGYFAHKRQLEAPSFATPDESSVRVTNMGIPNPQCRLDTYFAAALCAPEVTSQQSAQHAWLCLQGTVELSQVRPKCWFNTNNTVDKEHAVSDLLLLPKQGY